jgi:hypothetical protein
MSYIRGIKQYFNNIAYLHNVSTDSLISALSYAAPQGNPKGLRAVP